MSLEVTIAGEGCQLLFRIHSYEVADATRLDFDDANWLRGHVELVAGRSAGFTVRQDVSFRTTELAGFRNDLRTMVESLAGRAAFDHLEDQVGCDVRLERGKGEMAVWVKEHVGPTLGVDRVPTDQSYLSRTLQELDVVLAAFPIRPGGVSRT